MAGKRSSGLVNKTSSTPVSERVFEEIVMAGALEETIAKKRRFEKTSKGWFNGQTMLGLDERRKQDKASAAPSAINSN